MAEDGPHPWDRCSRPHNHPWLISEAQICHQCVIEHTSSPEATGPSPPAPLSDERAESGISPNSVKWCRKQKERGTRPTVSISPKSAALTSCETSSRCPHLSVNGKGGKGGGGGIGASSQSPLPSPMHNSVFLSQQPALRRAHLPPAMRPAVC